MALVSLGRNTGTVSLRESVRLQSRMNLVNSIAPELVANDASYALALVKSFIPDEQLIDGVIGAVGVAGIENMIRDLEEADDDYARAMFRSMPSAQRRAFFNKTGTNLRSIPRVVVGFWGNWQAKSRSRELRASRAPFKR